MLYVAIISLVVILLTILNSIFALLAFNGSIMLVFGVVALGVVAVILVDGLFAFVTRWLLPQKWFGVSNEFYTPSKKFCRFYEKIKIKKWKDRVPELGFFAGFRKNKLVDPTNNEYVGRFIVESNVGALAHLLGMIFGYVIMLFYPPFAFNVALPIAITNMVLNYLPYVILRYNLPKLRVLYKHNERKQTRNLVA